MTDREMPRKVEIIGIGGIQRIEKGDDLPKIIFNAAKNQRTPIREGDIIVVTSKVVSLSEGKTVDLRTVEPSSFARKIAAKLEKDPRMMEVILKEASSIVRMTQKHLITETKHGLVCANSGVDKSNVCGENNVATLPDDPDLSARKIGNGIKNIGGIDVAVVIADTFGRSLRRGLTSVAIGLTGLPPILDLRRTPDMYGTELRVTQIAVADELAAAAELVMGKTSWIPVVIIRGYKYERRADTTAKELTLPEEEDVFR